MKNYLIGIVLLLLSCNGQKKVGVKNADNQLSSDAPLVLLLQDEYGSFDVEETMIIRDMKRLKSFYSKINRTRKPGLPVPDINFSTEIVIVQCSGEQNHSGIPTLSFNKETSTQVLLDYKINKVPGDVTTAVVRNPFCVYKMPLTQKEILVEKGIK